MLTWKPNRDETSIVQDSNKIFNRRRQENELCARYNYNETKLPNRENEKKKKTVRNVIATNKVKRSRLDIDKNVRLERKGTFIARNIEVKVNKKK